MAIGAVKDINYLFQALGLASKEEPPNISISTTPATQILEAGNPSIYNLIINKDGSLNKEFEEKLLESLAEQEKQEYQRLKQKWEANKQDLFIEYLAKQNNQELNEIIEKIIYEILGKQLKIPNPFIDIPSLNSQTIPEIEEIILKINKIIDSVLKKYAKATDTSRNFGNRGGPCFLASDCLSLELRIKGKRAFSYDIADLHDLFFPKNQYNRIFSHGIVLEGDANGKPIRLWDMTIEQFIDPDTKRFLQSNLSAENSIVIKQLMEQGYIDITPENLFEYLKLTSCLIPSLEEDNHLQNITKLLTEIEIPAITSTILKNPMNFYSQYLSVHFSPPIKITPETLFPNTQNSLEALKRYYNLAELPFPIIE